MLLGGDAIPSLDRFGQPVRGNTLLILVNGSTSPRRVRPPRPRMRAIVGGLIDTRSAHPPAKSLPAGAGERYAMVGPIGGGDAPAPGAGGGQGRRGLTPNRPLTRREIQGVHDRHDASLGCGKASREKAERMHFFTPAAGRSEPASATLATAPSLPMTKRTETLPLRSGSLASPAS